MTSSCTQARKQAAQSRIFSLFALASRSPAVSQPLAKLTVRLRTARKRLLSRLPNLRTPGPTLMKSKFFTLTSAAVKVSVAVLDRKLVIRFCPGTKSVVVLSSFLLGGQIKRIRCDREESVLLTHSVCRQFIEHSSYHIIYMFIRNTDFSSKCTTNRLAAGLRPHPLRKLTPLTQSPLAGLRG